MDPVWAKFTVWFDRTIGRHSYRIHRRLYRWTGGLIGHRTMAGPMLLLTTVGRRTGQPRTTRLLYMPDGPGFVVVGSNGGRPEPPAWILNLTATPQVELQVGRRRCAAEAHILTGEAQADMWPRLIGHYPGWGSYQALTEREIKVVSLVPRPGPA
jgi:F420H(2)-dependent quinone reductase